MALARRMGGLALAKRMGSLDNISVTYGMNYTKTWVREVRRGN